MFKWLSLNNFCMSFFIFSALEPLTFLNIPSPSSPYKPISFLLYFFLKLIKKKITRKISVSGHFSLSVRITFLLYRWDIVRNLEFSNYHALLTTGDTYLSQMHLWISMHFRISELTQLFSMHPYSAPWKNRKVFWRFQGVFGVYFRVHWE